MWDVINVWFLIFWFIFYRDLIFWLLRWIFMFLNDSLNFLRFSSLIWRNLLRCRGFVREWMLCFCRSGRNRWLVWQNRGLWGRICSQQCCCWLITRQKSYWVCWRVSSWYYRHLYRIILLVLYQQNIYFFYRHLWYHHRWRRYLIDLFNLISWFDYDILYVFFVM